VEEDLLTFARLIDTSSEKEIEAGIKRLSEISGSRITIIDSSGKPLVDSEVDAATTENHLNRPEIQEARVKGIGRSVRLSVPPTSKPCKYHSSGTRTGGYIASRP